MNLLQGMRRLSQSLNGWAQADKMRNHQHALLNKLYARHGLQIINTCGACPEQYDVKKDGKQVAYYRLRHGEFRVDYLKCGGKTIYEYEPIGDGTFEDNERLVQLTKAMRAVLKEIASENI